MTLKGFYTSFDYVGFTDGGYKMVFPTDDEYAEYVREKEENNGGKDSKSSDKR